MKNGKSGSKTQDNSEETTGAHVFGEYKSESPFELDTTLRHLILQAKVRHASECTIKFLESLLWQLSRRNNLLLLPRFNSMFLLYQFTIVIINHSKHPTPSLWPVPQKIRPLLCCDRNNCILQTKDFNFHKTNSLGFSIIIKSLVKSKSSPSSLLLTL